MAPSSTPGPVLTLSEAWTNAARAVMYTIHQERKARIQFLKKTEYGKEFLMRMTEVATVEAVGSGNTVQVACGAQLPDKSANQATEMADGKLHSKTQTKVAASSDLAPTNRKMSASHAQSQCEPIATETPTEIDSIASRAGGSQKRSKSSKGAPIKPTAKDEKTEEHDNVAALALGGCYGMF